VPVSDLCLASGFQASGKSANIMAVRGPSGKSRILSMSVAHGLV
jgi:hypothetical protein